jgi:hypothetical protein
MARVVFEPRTAGDKGDAREGTRASRRRAPALAGVQVSGANYGDLSARRDVILARLKGAPCSRMAHEGCLVLLLEGAPPLPIPVDALDPVLVISMGTRLAPASWGEIRRVIADGLVPVVTLIDGHACVDAACLHPLSSGGNS